MADLRVKGFAPWYRINFQLFCQYFAKSTKVPIFTILLVFMKQMNLIIHGNVQGVGFRYHVLKAAREMGVVGCVQNMDDGSVRVRAQGAEPQLTELYRWCKQESPHATIEKIDEEVVDIEEQMFDSFDIR